MSVSLAPTFGAGYQSFTALGLPNAAGSIYTYAAGTSTPLATYTDSTGGTPNSDPITLGTDGKPPSEIWLTDGLAYKFVIKDVFGSTLPNSTYDNISGGITSTALAASSGSSLVGFIQAGTGAIATDAQTKMRERVSVFDALSAAQKADVLASTYTLDTAATIQAWINNQSGKHIEWPAGGYRFDSTITVSVPCLLDGFSPAAVTLQTTSATAPHFTIGSGNVHIAGFAFNSSVTKSSGGFIDTNSQSNFSLSNFTMTGAFRGIKINGGSIINIGTADAVASITNSVPSTGRSIYITGSPFAVNITGVVMDAPSGSQPLAGIYIDGCGDVIIDKCNIIHQGTDLNIVPGAGGVCSSVWASNTFFDTANVGLNIAPTSTGAVVRCRFANCWFSSHTTFGVSITGGASSKINGVSFIDPHIYSNTNNGFYVGTTTNVSNITIIGGEIAGNSSGVVFNGAMNDFVIEGASIGAVGDISANSGYGIYFGGTISNCSVVGNKLLSNALGQISLPGGAVGANVQIASNPGFNPIGVVGISPGASPYTYTAGHTAETVMINAGTVSLVSINGSSVYTGTNVSVPVNAGGTVTVTYTVAPGMATFKS